MYLNDELVTTVNANGPAEPNVRLFEMTDLTPAIYTLKIVCKTGVIDVDKFAYQAATPELNYTRVDALSGQITYSGTWTEDHNEANYLSNAMGTTEFGATAKDMMVTAFDKQEVPFAVWNVKENIQRLLVLQWDKPQKISKLTVTVRSTWGQAEARIFRISAYGQCLPKGLQPKK